MSEPMLCPRRAEGVPAGLENTTDRWREDGTCSFCGSLSPEEFLRRCETGVELGPTDKSYKVYTKGGPHTGKFYFQHLSPEQQTRFIELHNQKRLNIGYPGRFYVDPFFCTRAPKGEAGAR